MKTKKFISIILIIFIITFYYFLAPTFILPDTNLYYISLKVLLGVESILSYPVVRGPSLALTLFPFFKLFGNTEISFRICTYIFYIALLITIFYFFKKEIYNKVLKSKQKMYKKIFYTIFIIFIILNPILYGYYHTMLTEFSAITFSIINIVIVSKINDNKKLTKKNLIINLIYFIFVFIYSWFLKQPYITISFFPLLALLFLKIKNKTNRIKTLILFIVPIISLLISMKLWDNFLTVSGIKYNAGESTNYYLNKALIDSNTNYEKDNNESIYTKNGINNNPYLTEKEKQFLINKINKNEKNYIIYYVHNIKNDVIDTEIFIYKGQNFSKREAINFTLGALVKHPIIVVDSYISNYLSSINIYGLHCMNNYYRPVKKITLFDGENHGIGLAHLSNIKNNYLGLQGGEESLKELIVNYNTYDKYDITVFFSYFYLILFKIMYLILPIFWIFILIKVLKKNRQYETTFLFITFVLMHTLFHTITGAIIDRYIYVTYPAYICGIISFIISLNQNKNN